EVASLALVAEEQPVFSGRAGGLSLVQESTKRRDAGAGPDHDDRPGRIVGQREMLRLLYINLDFIAGSDTAAEEGRADAEPHALFNVVAHRIDGERDAARRAVMRRRDRINPRLQRIERLNKRLGIGPDTGKLLQRREDVERCRVAVRIAAFREQLR